MSACRMFPCCSSQAPSPPARPCYTLSMSDLDLNAEQATKNELNNLLMAIALKCDLLRARNADRAIRRPSRY